MRLTSLTILFALIGFLHASDALAGDTNTEIQAFLTSNYDYCDAKLLGAYWGQEISESKARIGRKLGWGDTAILDGMLGSARAQAIARSNPTCSYHEAGYTYADAEAIAKLWGISPSEAKVAMEYKINSGHEDLLKAELERAGPTKPATDDADVAFSRYANSKYCYCDARVLGAFWGIDPFESKLTIGRKLGWGNGSIVESELTGARTAAVARGETCAFYETNFTSADANTLAQAWKMPVSAAKAKVGKLVITGKAARVRAALGKPKGKR